MNEKIKGRALHTEKVPDSAEACGRRGRQGSDLIGLLDHSNFGFEFPNLRTIGGL